MHKKDDPLGSGKYKISEGFFTAGGTAVR